MDSQRLDYRDSELQETGTHHSSKSQVVVCPFDRYLVQIELGPGDEFLGIVGVTVNKAFLSAAQKIASLRALGYHDVDEFYRQPEEE